MATPYTWVDGGTASFPIEEYDVGDPDLAAAANALWYSSDNSIPVTTFDPGHPWPGEGGSVSLPLTMADSPDGRALANYLAGLGSLPLTEAGTYVNPANSSSPDAVYALNFLFDTL